MRTRHFSGIDNFIHGSIWPADYDVISYTAVKKVIFLHYYTNLTSQPADINILNGFTIKDNITIFWLIQELNNVCKGGFTGTASAYNTNFLTRLYCEVDSLQYKRCIHTIAEINIFQLNFTGKTVGTLTDVVHQNWLDSSIENIADTLKGKAHLLNLWPHSEKLCHRSDRLTGNHLEGDELTECKFTVHYHMTAIPHDTQGRQTLQGTGKTAKY